MAARKAGASRLRMVNWALRMKERGAIFLMVGGVGVGEVMVVAVAVVAGVLVVLVLVGVGIGLIGIEF